MAPGKDDEEPKVNRPPDQSPAVEGATPAPEHGESKGAPATPSDSFAVALQETMREVVRFRPDHFDAIEAVLRELPFFPLEQDARPVFRALDDALSYSFDFAEHKVDSYMLLAVIAFPESLELDKVENEAAAGRILRLRSIYGRHASRILQLDNEGPRDWIRARAEGMVVGRATYAEHRVAVYVERLDGRTFELGMSPSSYVRFLDRLLTDFGALPDAVKSELEESDWLRLRVAAERALPKDVQGTSSQDKSG